MGKNNYLNVSLYDRSDVSHLEVSPSPNCVMEVGANDSSAAPDKRECGCLTRERLFNLALCCSVAEFITVISPQPFILVCDWDTVEIHFPFSIHLDLIQGFFFPP